MIPAQVIADISLFQASVQAAVPVRKAAPLTKAALLTAGQSIVAEIDAALAAAAGSLDAADPSGFAGDLVADLLALDDAASDQTVLADIRGTMGRALFNLAQTITAPSGA